MEHSSAPRAGPAGGSDGPVSFPFASQMGVYLAARSDRLASLGRIARGHHDAHLIRRAAHLEGAGEELPGFVKALGAGVGVAPPELGPPALLSALPPRGRGLLVVQAAR